MSQRVGSDTVQGLTEKAANPALAQIPVVIMTTSTRLPDLAATVATLWNPFSPEALIEVVRKYAPLGPPPAVA